MKAFSPYGEIVSTKIIRYPPEHVVSKGYGFVNFKNEASRSKVLTLHRKIAIKGSLVAIQMGGRRKTGRDNQLAQTTMVTPSPYSYTQYFQDPATGQIYMMPQAVPPGMPTMASTYPAMQPMYYQQPMQMMTIAPTMPQMTIPQTVPQVTMAIAQKPVTIAAKPGILQQA